jgi:hypothetical protein
MACHEGIHVTVDQVFIGETRSRKTTELQGTAKCNSSNVENATGEAISDHKSCAQFSALHKRKLPREGK